MQKIASAAASHAVKPAAGERKGRGETPEAASPSAGQNVVAAAHRKITHEEKMAALRFIKAAHEDALRYIDMTEEEVEEEYRRAGKLHVYDPESRTRSGRSATLELVECTPRPSSSPQNSTSSPSSSRKTRTAILSG